MSVGCHSAWKIVLEFDPKSISGCKTQLLKSLLILIIPGLNFVAREIYKSWLLCCCEIGFASFDEIQGILLKRFNPNRIFPKRHSWFFIPTTQRNVVEAGWNWRSLISVKSNFEYINRCWGSRKSVWCLYDDRWTSHHEASSPIPTTQPVAKVLIIIRRPLVPHLRTKMYCER